MSQEPRLELLRLSWPVPEQSLRQWQQVCCSSRLARAQRYRSAEDRARCLAAGWLLSRLFPGPIDETRSELGRPGLCGRPEMHLSLTHSGDWVAAAAHEHAVGLDVEQVRPVAEGVERMFMTGPEQDRFARLQGPERQDFFFKIWTAKEAWLKAQGTGFAGRDRVTQEPDWLKLPWKLRQKSLEGDYWLALCWEDKEAVHDRSRIA